MTKRALRFRALIISAVFCVSLISLTLVVNHASALAPSDSEKALTNFNNSFIVHQNPRTNAVILGVTAEHNVTAFWGGSAWHVNDGRNIQVEKGMQIHAQVRAKVDVPCTMTAQVYFDQFYFDVERQRAGLPQIDWTSGPPLYVSAENNFTAVSDYGELSRTFDVTLFLPYKALNLASEALNLASGKYDMQVKLELYYIADKKRVFDDRKTYRFHLDVLTAHISSVKIGKDKAVNEESSSFEDGDTVYVVVTISNAVRKMTVRSRMVVEDRPGMPPGTAPWPIPGKEKTTEKTGSGTLTYTFAPPMWNTPGPRGPGVPFWPKAKYKVEFTLMNEAGEQKDEKSVRFSVGY